MKYFLIDNRPIESEIDLSSQYRARCQEISYEKYLELKNPIQTFAQAWQKGEEYVSRFYSPLQLLTMQSMLIGVLPATDSQKAKIADSFAWITQKLNEGVTSPSTFQQSGSPNYSFFDIVSNQQ